jgi:hypothetical protein
VAPKEFIRQDYHWLSRRQRATIRRSAQRARFRASAGVRGHGGELDVTADEYGVRPLVPDRSFEGSGEGRLVSDGGSRIAQGPIEADAQRVWIESYDRDVKGAAQQGLSQSLAKEAARPGNRDLHRRRRVSSTMCYVRQAPHNPPCLACTFRPGYPTSSKAPDRLGPDSWHRYGM